MEPRLREHFEIPRPSLAYAASLQALPSVFVGTPRQLAALVAWMAARLRTAFAQAEMPVPPWRAARAMLKMWRLDTSEGAAAARAAEDDDDIMLAEAAAEPPRALAAAQRGWVAAGEGRWGARPGAA